MALRIKKLRQDRGMTQIDLSVAADIPQSTVSQIENGTHNPTLETLNRFAKALNVPAPMLFDGEADPTPAAALVRKFTKLSDEEKAAVLQTVDAILARQPAG